MGREGGKVWWEKDRVAREGATGRCKRRVRAEVGKLGAEGRRLGEERNHGSKWLENNAEAPPVPT